MKKIYRYFFAAVAIASAAACAEQMENDQVPGGQAGPADFAQMTISASLGEVTKTTYKDQSVLWEGTESITVFSKGSEDAPTEFAMNWCSEDKAKASFTGLADLNAESYYAVYPHSATNACTSEGVLTVNIPTEQTAVAGGFASGANVAVAGFAKDDANVVFNNVSSLLSFGFETDADAILTKSVTVKVKKNATEYYGIAGNVSVNYEADGDLVVSEGSAQSIVLNAPEGGFAKGETYYVAVAPVGTVAELELLYTHTDGTTTCEKKNSNIVASLTRSTLVPLETIPVAYDDLPQEDFEFVFDFTGEWPFEEPCVALENQVDKGIDYYSYLYKYVYNGEEKSRTFATALTWGVFSGDQGYEHVDGALLCKSNPNSGNDNGTTYIKIPAVSGRYLKAVKVLHNSGKTRQFNFFRGFAETQISGNTDVRDGVEYSYTLPRTYGKVTYESELGTEYSVRARSLNIKITKIVAIYSKTKPE